MMWWCLRRPRKLLLITLTGALIWAGFGYFMSRVSNQSESHHELAVENLDLSHYDEPFQGKATTERVQFLDKQSFKVEKSKLDEAVNREEKNNLIKHERLKQEIEDVEIVEGQPAELVKYFTHQGSESVEQHPIPFDPSTLQQILYTPTNRKIRSISLLTFVNTTMQPAEKLTKITEHNHRYGHNETVSQTVSLHRPLPDVRDVHCRNIEYPNNLPDASVVIAFYNEAWTTLLRTVHSILDHSPLELVQEIILIDDFSTYEHLQQQLKDYIALLPKVILRRTTSRVGVIAARQIGASMTKGTVLIFLDSHCECTKGWLEPLLERIQDNETHVVTPVMDIIDDQTFEYKSFDAKSINIGGFDWNLQFVWIGLPERAKKMQKSEIDFISSPTMPGGMFAISRKYFNKLGGYDPGMDMWGAENLEMSFKIWMCGGTLETVPCSHVGHLFRHGTSYKIGVGDPRKNFFRLAEVWLDDYKELYYQKTGKATELHEDVVNRKMLRKQLKCQSFGWYLKNIYPELFIPSESLAAGEIKNKDHAFADGLSFPACLDAATGTSITQVKIWPCHNQGGNQFWMLSKTGEIRRDDGCMDYSGKSVVVLPCHGQKGNQAWEYSSDNTIQHINSKFCMGLSSDRGTLAMSQCSGKSSQTWHWKRQSAQKRLEDENQLLQEIAVDSY